MLAGIVAGVILGLASGNARLVVIEGSVPTGVFGLYFLGSLLSQRPMMFRFPLQAMGADTPKGRAFAERWRFTGFRRACRIMTAVWGVGFLATTAATVLIAETTSTDTANGTTTGLSITVVAVLIAWTITYSKRRQREGERRGGADARNDNVPQPDRDATAPDRAGDRSPCDGRRSAIEAQGDERVRAGGRAREGPPSRRRLRPRRQRSATSSTGDSI